MNHRFIALKLARTLLTLWLAVTFVFIVLRVSGDPVQALLPPDAPVQEIEFFRVKWGLDQPLPLQYARYIGNVLSGDFGFSYRNGKPAIEVVAERIPATLLLGFTALAVTILVGIPLGIVAALNRNRMGDRLVMSFAVFAFAVPNFFFGILLILLFSLGLRWLPSSGMGSPAQLVMPALTLGLATAGALARFTRSAMLEVLSKPYMQAAKAKGVPFLRRILRHALPNAAIPIVTVLGFSLGGLIGGAIVTESVFAWPGVGRLLYTAVNARDLSVVQALVLLIALTMVAANLTVDLLYGWLDPRIRVGGGGERQA